MISIIVPVYNEIQFLDQFLETLSTFSGEFELIFVDDSSDDGSDLKISEFINNHSNANFIRINRHHGVAPGCNKGAEIANGDIFWFLPVDCNPPENSIQLIESICGNDERIIGGGFFKRYIPRSFWLIPGEYYLNYWRLGFSKYTVSTNAIFIKRDTFEKLEGYTEHGFLDDVIFSDRMKKSGKIASVKKPVIVSSRRYQRDGIISRMLKNILIVILFRLGYDIERLKKLYSKKA